MSIGLISDTHIPEVLEVLPGQSVRLQYCYPAVIVNISTVIGGKDET
jgi:hypothetical protein